jgi:uncharacterized protein YqjF (DUF2071 family)
MTDTFLSARWENIIMANYEVNPDILAPYLPHGVELDFFNEKTYVSLVGFHVQTNQLVPHSYSIFRNVRRNQSEVLCKKNGRQYVKRGVVFINETVPYKPVAWLANKLYKEHYTAIPTKNKIELNQHSKHINYQWKINKNWNHLDVQTAAESEPMKPDSIEEFIFEHYYGYTKINKHTTQEYKVNHPRWLINQVNDYSINCDFEAMYGTDFAHLSNKQPDSVIMAEGSAVTVNWKRTSI